jgi:hypothetical protein
LNVSVAPASKGSRSTAVDIARDSRITPEARFVPIRSRAVSWQRHRA